MRRMLERLLGWRYVWIKRIGRDTYLRRIHIDPWGECHCMLDSTDIVLHFNGTGKASAYSSFEYQWKLYTDPKVIPFTRKHVDWFDNYLKGASQ